MGSIIINHHCSTFNLISDWRLGLGSRQWLSWAEQVRDTAVTFAILFWLNHISEASSLINVGAVSTFKIQPKLQQKWSLEYIANTS